MATMDMATLRGERGPRWATAYSEEEALRAAYDEIKGRVSAFLKAREEETAFAQQAMLTVASDDQVELSTLWTSSEAPVDGQAENS